MRQIIPDRSGTSTIELALVMPVLAFLIFMAADVAMAFKAKIQFQRAAGQAAQMVSAGGLLGETYDSANLKADAAAAANVSPDAVHITKSLLCNGAVQSATPELPCAEGEQTKRYVEIVVTGTYIPMFAKWLSGGPWSTNGVALKGAASVRLQ